MNSTELCQENLDYSTVETSEDYDYSKPHLVKIVAAHKTTLCQNQEFVVRLPLYCLGQANKAVKEKFGKEYFAMTMKFV